MTMQPFKIQSPTLSLNGVNIDTSQQGKLVIPGITRAGTSVAIEVNDTGDQTVNWGANLDPTQLTIIDGYQFAVLNGDVQSPIVGWTAATYAADEVDGEGYIDGISVVDGGAGYTGEAVTYSQQMLASIHVDPINNFNPGDWEWIPFAVRCGAGTIESEFGSGSGGNGLVERAVNYPTGEDGDTAGTMALDPSGNVYVCTADYSQNEPQGYTVVASESYNISQSTNGTDMVLTVVKGTWSGLDTLMTSLGSPVLVGWQLSQNNATDGYTRECVAADAGANWTFTWQYVSGQDNASFSQNDEFELTYTLPQAVIWTQSNLGRLSVDNQILTSRSDLIGGESAIGVFNSSLDMFVESNTDRSFAEVWLKNGDTSAPTAEINVKAASPSWGPEGVKTWSFDSQGGLTFPDNTTQTTAYTGQSGSSSGELYIFVNADGTVITSTDGITWGQPVASGVPGCGDGNGPGTQGGVGKAEVHGSTIVYTRSDIGMDTITPQTGLYYSTVLGTATLCAGTDSLFGDDLFWNEVHYFSATATWVAVGYAQGSVMYPVVAHSLNGISWTVVAVNGTFLGDWSNGFSINAQFTDVVYNTVTSQYVISCVRSTMGVVYGGMFVTGDITQALDYPNFVDVDINGWRLAYWPQVFMSGPGMVYVVSQKDDGTFGLWGGGPSQTNSTDLFDPANWQAYYGPGTNNGWLESALFDNLGYVPDISEIAYNDNVFIVTTRDGQVFVQPDFPATFVEIPNPYTANINDIVRNDPTRGFINTSTFTVSPSVSTQDTYWTAVPFDGNVTVGSDVFHVTIDGDSILTSCTLVTSDVHSVGDTIVLPGDAFGGDAVQDAITITVNDVLPSPTTIVFTDITGNGPAADGEKITISGVTSHSEGGTTEQSYNGTYYIKDNNGSYELYLDSALTQPWDTSSYWPVNQNTGILTWSHGEWLDAAGAGGGFLFVGNDDEQVFRSTDFGQTWTQEQAVTGRYFNDFAYGTFGSGVTLNELVNGQYTVSLDADGNLNLEDGAHSGQYGRIQSLNGYPTLMAYGGESGHGGPELDWMDSNNPTADFFSNTALRHSMYLNDQQGLYIGMNENQKPGHFSGNWNFNTDGSLSLPQESIVGSFVNVTSNDSYNEWFVSSVAGPDGTIYAIGGEQNTNDYHILAHDKNNTLWRRAFTGNQDFGDGTGGHQPLGLNIKFDTVHNLVFAGFDSGNSTGVVSLNPNNGSVGNTWLVKAGTNGTQSVSQKSFDIDPQGRPVIAGHSYGSYISYSGLTGTKGVDGYTNDYVTVAMSDIGDINGLGSNGGNWQLDIDGAGTWYELADFNVYYGVPAEYVGTPGQGGVKTATEGTAYSTGGLTGSTGIGMDLDVTKWTDSTLMNTILSQSNGIHYTVVIGSLTPGVDQTVLTFSSISDWVNTAPGVYHMDGNWSVVSGTGNVDTTATDIMSITYGSVMRITLYPYVDSNGGRYLDGVNFADYGTNYQNGDALVVKGSNLGGRDGGFIMSATPSGNRHDGNGDVLIFDISSYPTLGTDIPTGSLFRFSDTNYLGQTVVSVVDNGQGSWEVTITGGHVSMNSVDFFAGNDWTFTYNGNNWFSSQGNWLPAETARLVMSQAVTSQISYNVRRVEGQQAFIWTPDWSHSFGSSNRSEYFDDVAYDSVNNRIFVTGYFQQGGINAECLVMALDAATGDTLWQKFIGDNNTGNYGYTGSIDTDANGDVITIGTNDNGQAMITKQSGSDGTILWQTVQTNQSNWNSQPVGKVDDNGDVYFGNVYYENNYNHYVLSLVKLNGNNGSLNWARIVNDTQNYWMYDMWDTFSQSINVGGGQVQWGGYVSDIYNDYDDALAVSLPQNGTGLGTYGRWELTEDTNAAFIVGNDSYCITPTTPYTPTDSLTLTLTNPTIDFYDASGATITRNNISLGGGSIIFPDGSDITQAGIARALQDKGDNTTYLDFSHNGKFIYFSGNNGQSTVRVPQNFDQSLPVGYTVTLVIDDFDYSNVLVNTGGDTTNGLHISAVGFSQSYSNNNWWRLGTDNNVGIYTLMKVDTNRWVLSGPSVTDDY